MKYELVIFDWDGTLMDSVARIVSCLQSSATIARLPVPTESAVRDIIGMSLKEAFDQLFPSINEEQVSHMTALYREHYLEIDDTPTPLFDGVHDMLAAATATGAQLAVATGKARAGLNRVLSVSELEECFVASRCADEASSKPSPDMIHQLLLELDIAADKALMVGDSSLDMQMAKAAGVAAVGVSYGAHGEETLAEHGPVAIIHHPSELHRHL